MKSFAVPVGLGLIIFFFGGCASTSSHVLVGSRHPAINPSEVKLYLHPPANYEEIALVSSDSWNSLASSAQAQTDLAIARLKVEAAKLGANGIVLSSVGDKYAGSVNTSSGYFLEGGIVSGKPFPPPFYHQTGGWISMPLLNKAAAGIAIYVEQK